MKMKKLAAIVCAGLMTASLAACGGGTGSESSASGSSAADSSAASSAVSESAAASSAAESSAASSTSAESGSEAIEGAGEGYKMTFVMGLRDEWLSTLEAAAFEAAEETGVEISTQDAQSDSNKILQFIETARNAGEDAVMINLVDGETGEACIEAAGDMNIVLVNMPPADYTVVGGDHQNAAFVGSDNYEAGVMQAKYLANRLKAEGKDTLRYIMLNGTLAMQHTTLHTDGVLETLEAEGIKAEAVAEPLVAEYDRATAMDMISPLLGTVEFDAIISNNDAMALGAIEALHAKNMDPADYIIVGVDATVDGCTAVEECELSMTAFQNAKGQGRGAFMAAINTIEGKAINEGTDFDVDADNDHIVWVPFEEVTAENVADYQ